jgi:hypothetical protein
MEKEALRKADAKDNFSFERAISGWRRAITVLDLRLKK